MSQKVIGLIFTHENRALALSTQYWCERFARHSTVATDIIDLKSMEDLSRLQAILKSGEVAFCFGLQGVGSRLMATNEESLWTRFKTPFLGLHHDSPSCNIYNHFCDSPYVANLYFFGCLYDIQKRYVKSQQINETLPYEIEPAVFNKIKFADRPIRYSFIKSGKSPQIYIDKINQIKSPLREALWVAIETAEKNENLVICDLLTKAFNDCGYDTKDHWSEFWGFADWIDNYLRTKRATDLVNFLKFQEGSVIIGDGWDFIDKTGSKALFKSSITAVETFDVYSQSQFVFNTSPYGSDMIHERNILGLSLHAYVVSDTNAWWDKNFSDVPGFARFNWGKDYQEQILGALNDPSAEDKANAGLGGKRVYEKCYGVSQIPKIISIAERIRAVAEEPIKKL